MKLGSIAAVALAMAVPAVAQAHEFKPSWGYALVADDPFNDPAAGGALMETTQVFPRGRIRDTIVDGKDVRMTINVFTHGSGTPVGAYHVNEGDFVDVSFDRRLDVTPFQIAYVKYDFCRFNPSNGAIEVCEPALRIGRPPPPQPPNGDPPPPEDRDRDGVPVTTDCVDTNATIWPGAPEIAGNGIDEDCSGADQPGRLSATLKHSWAVKGRRARVTEFRIREAPANASVEVRCKGKRCPFRVKKTRVKANGTAQLRKFFRRRLRAGVTIEVRILAPNMIGKVVRLPIKRGKIPTGRTLCLPPGVKKPTRC